VSACARLAVVGYFARAHGLAGLRALFDCERYRVAAIVTHRRFPKSEDPERSERPEFAEYSALAATHAVPLFAVDSTAAQAEAVAALDRLRFDLIAAISWRRLLAPRQLAQPRLGGVNLHRGALPRYAGAEPVLRALRDGAREIEICAHVLTSEIDAGEVLARVRHPTRAFPGESLEAQAERVKREITPLFGPLLVEALDILVSRHER
jgi:methionyl-tRNA formyltransferase